MNVVSRERMIEHSWFTAHSNQEIQLPISFQHKIYLSDQRIWLKWLHVISQERLIAQRWFSTHLNQKTQLSISLI